MRNLKSVFPRAATVLSVLAVTLTLAVAPASAHSLDQAVRAPAGCAWLSGGYSALHSSAVTTPAGTRYGTVYLLWSNTYRQNCVVTLKTSFHGTPTWTTSTLWLQNGSRYREQGNYGHFASTTAAAAGVCVAYWGTISSTPGSTGGITASGGRLEYDNCS
ncbi:hypothetical protein [Nocardiopsis lambiniae]|uniref:Spore-associated protein A n=1 Tax=Nocardiopsis lambiniae TaxID=3075539 RepID=A0ABU2MCI2_9ACTN|nr:hypothetical protein [Nocardiopsis sp. DSM 44743]MDT0330307.1 hypothetical protein [Nocardiopsis sp. DSM 44743]